MSTPSRFKRIDRVMRLGPYGSEKWTANVELPSIAIPKPVLHADVSSIRPAKRYCAAIGKFGIDACTGHFVNLSPDLGGSHAFIFQCAAPIASDNGWRLARANASITDFCSSLASPRLVGSACPGQRAGLVEHRHIDFGKPFKRDCRPSPICQRASKRLPPQSAPQEPRGQARMDK